MVQNSYSSLFILNIHGLAADLAWLGSLVPDQFPQPAGQDLTELIDYWQRPAVPGKRILRRGWRMRRST